MKVVINESIKYQLKPTIMKHYKWISLLFAAALTMGACSDDENNYGETGVIIEEPVATEATLKVCR